MLMMPLVIQAITDPDAHQYMEWLYTEFHRLMLATAWRFSQSQADVEDIVSDSCVALIRKISDLRGMEHNALRAYIVATVRNTAIDLCRKQKQNNARFHQGHDEMVKRVADQGTVEGKVALRESLRLLRQAMAELPDLEREVLRLKFQYNKHDCEIAAITGLSESSVRKYILRARQHLKKALY